MSFKCRACKENITEFDEAKCEICGAFGCSHCLEKIDKYDYNGICGICKNKTKYEFGQKRMF